jgi:hypothetical protein
MRVNTEGGQVADSWAFRADSAAEHMSMPRSVVCLGRIKAPVRDVLVSNLRRLMLKLLEDT